MTWPTLPIRRIFRVINGGTPASDPANWEGQVSWATPADIGQRNGKTITTTERTLTATGLKAGSRAVCKGSLLVSTRAPIGYVAETTRMMAFNQGCKGLEPTQEIDTRFFRYQLSVMDEELQSRGQGSTFLELSGDALAATSVVVPPHQDQRAIANYLDIETGRIDDLISKKRRMMRLLGERRVSRVESALSRFQPLRLKRYVTKIGSGSTPRGGADVYVPSGSAFLRSQNVRNGLMDLSDAVFIDSAAQNELRRALVYPGDVLLNITGASIGRAAVFDCSGIQAYVSQHVCIVRPRPGVDASVLCAELLSHSVQEHIAVAQVGGNREGLNFEQVGNLLVRVPPVDQAQVIAQELAAGFSRSMRARETLRAQIDLLRERRQALITATVTGELAIPGVAA